MELFKDGLLKLEKKLNLYILNCLPDVRVNNLGEVVVVVVLPSKLMFDASSLIFFLTFDLIIITIAKIL